MSKHNDQKTSKSPDSTPKDMDAITCPPESFRWMEKLTHLLNAMSSGELALNSVRDFKLFSSVFGDSTAGHDKLLFQGKSDGCDVRIQYGRHFGGALGFHYGPGECSVTFGAESLTIRESSDQGLKDLIVAVHKKANQMSRFDKESARQAPRATGDKLTELTTLLYSGYDFGWSRHHFSYSTTSHGLGGLDGRDSPEIKSGSDTEFKGCFGDTLVRIGRFYETSKLGAKAPSTEDNYTLILTSKESGLITSASPEVAKALFEELLKRVPETTW